MGVWTWKCTNPGLWNHVGLTGTQMRFISSANWVICGSGIKSDIVFYMNKYQAGQPSIARPSRRLRQLIRNWLDMVGESDPGRRRRAKISTRQRSLSNFKLLSRRRWEEQEMRTLGDWDIKVVRKLWRMWNENEVVSSPEFLLLLQLLLTAHAGEEKLFTTDNSFTQLFSETLSYHMREPSLYLYKSLRQNCYAKESLLSMLCSQPGSKLPRRASNGSKRTADHLLSFVSHKMSPSTLIPPFPASFSYNTPNLNSAFRRVSTAN